MSEPNTNWTAKRAESPFGPVVQVTLMDGATVYLHPDIAREFGKQLRTASDQCEAGQSTLIG
jgi:hypothetical protein